MSTAPAPDTRAGSPGAPRASAAPRRTLSFAQGTWLVAQRELTMRLRSKSFLISTGILMLAILASIIVSGIVSASMAGSTVKVAAVSATASELAGIEGLEVTDAPSVEAAEQLVRDGTVEAAVVPAASGSALPYAIVALDERPGTLVTLLSATPEVQLLDPAPADGLLAYFIGIAFGVVFFMSAVTFGATIAQSVVEEKQTRVVEILLSTISARELMAGKVVGNSLLAFGQIALIAVMAGLGLMITGQAALLSMLGPAIAWFIVFFVFGFVLIAALYAAVAALVSRQEEVGSVTSPVTTLVMIPYFLVVFFNSNETVMAVMSYVPFSAPIGMPLRLFLGDAQWWEPLAALLVLIVTTVLVIVIGSRIYANSLLRTGVRVKLRDALRG